jgi:hypothetical protein
MVIIGIGAGAAIGGPKQMIVGALFNGLTLSPMLYWLKL